MDSAPAGATRMGSRSSTRHGGPAQVFVGPVRKWRKVWSPVPSVSPTPSPSAARVVLYKWNPLTASNGVKEDTTTPEQTTAPPDKPVKYLPVSVVVQRNKDEIAREAADEKEAAAEAEAEAEAEAQLQAENKEQDGDEKAMDITVGVEEDDSSPSIDKAEDPTLPTVPVDMALE